MLDAWLSVDSGHLVISEDRAEKERERAAREDVERRLRELELTLTPRPR
jgi:hypothetical protein